MYVPAYAVEGLVLLNILMPVYINLHIVFEASVHVRWYNISKPSNKHFTELHKYDVRYPSAS